VAVATHEHVEPRVLARHEHSLSRKHISVNALKVLYRLHRSRYLSYLVGGGVRDLLLQGRPKDFDVATNARPDEIRRLFRNSRVIGRRFRLVHVFFKDEVVEVSTFRASPEPPEGPEDAEVPEEEVGDVVGEDPTYGTPAEDARRRDFTVNALFYSIADFSVIDYVGGIDDLERRILRTIGDPEQRFGEDPVRMMRALEYSVRLGFALDPLTERALGRCCDLIGETAPARLIYELIEGLHSGHAAGIWEAWTRHGLSRAAFPEVVPDPRIRTVLDCIDRRVGAGERWPDASLLGSLFLPRFVDTVESLCGERSRLSNPELLERLAEMLEPVGARMHLPHHALHLIRHGLFTITKLRRVPERGRQVIRLARQDYFPVAWDLFSLGAESGLLPRDAWAAWSRALAQVRGGALGDDDDLGVDPARRTRRRRRRRPGARRRT